MARPDCGQVCQALESHGQCHLALYVPGAPCRSQDWNPGPEDCHHSKGPAHERAHRAVLAGSAPEGRVCHRSQLRQVAGNPHPKMAAAKDTTPMKKIRLWIY